MYEYNLLDNLIYETLLSQEQASRERMDSSISDLKVSFNVRRENQ